MARLSTPPRSFNVLDVANMEIVLIDYRTTTNPAVEHIAAMLMAHDYRVSVYNVDDDPDGSVIKDLDERSFPTTKCANITVKILLNTGRGRCLKKETLNTLS